MDALDFNQILDSDKSIVNDYTPAAELTAIAAKSEQLDTDLTSANDTQNDIVNHRSGGANHLARYFLN